MHVFQGSSTFSDVRLATRPLLASVGGRAFLEHLPREDRALVEGIVVRAARRRGATGVTVWATAWRALERRERHDLLEIFYTYWRAASSFVEWAVGQAQERRCGGLLAAAVQIAAMRWGALDAEAEE